MKASSRVTLARTEQRRRLVVVDIENIAGGACMAAETVHGAKLALMRTLHLVPPDLIVLGTSHIGLLTVGCNWPAVRYVVRSGTDGADLALLDVLAENVPARFGEVVLASGDGIFIDAVTALGADGVAVTVVARREWMSRRFKLAARNLVYLDDPLTESAAVEVAGRAA